jgi:tellurite resistance protein TehA-like permease
MYVLCVMFIVFAVMAPVLARRGRLGRLPFYVGLAAIMFGIAHLLGNRNVKIGSQSLVIDIFVTGIGIFGCLVGVALIGLCRIGDPRRKANTQH